MKPTIVLVHGAFAESASWNKVIDSLAGAGHPVIAAPNPLRSPAADAAAAGDLLCTVDGPVVLVAHSYGGMVISNVPADAGQITGLVYACASVVTERFHAQFCADVPAPQAARMAATQRPPTLEALTEPSGDRPLRRELPSWFLIGEQDHTIPAALQRFMADRAGARRALEIPGASHAAAVSHPEETAELILQAAALPAAA